MLQKLQKLLQNIAQIDLQDLDFLESCLDHPKDHVSLMASEILSKSTHPKAFNILFEKIQKIDKDIQIQTKEIDSQKQSFYEKFADDLEVPSFYSSNRSSQSDIQSGLHPKIKEGNFAILDPYKSISEQNITNENLRFVILRLLENPEEKPIHQYAALQSLKAFSQTPPVEIIHHYLYGSNNETKQAAIEILAFFQLNQFVPRLEVELMSLQPSIVIQAIYALIEMKAHNSISKIKHLQSHRHPLVQNAVRFAIRAL
ncbi:MAG: hypothetical protein KC646_12075 [Candidatus Cloacimonetes bacterium]|nr:hypothetical protein [Candidatus Cloacimonadota bacterium]